MSHGCHRCGCPNGCECPEYLESIAKYKEPEIVTMIKPLVTRLQEEAIYLRDRFQGDYNLEHCPALLEEAIAEITRLQDLVDAQLTKDHTP
jgi:hypothetical protein